MVQYWPEFLSLAIIHFVAVILAGPRLCYYSQTELKIRQTTWRNDSLGNWRWA